MSEPNVKKRVCRCKPFQNKIINTLHHSFSRKDTAKGRTATAQSATPIQEIPFVQMSWHAVVAISPPIVRLALHRLKSPLVLNAWVMSKALSKSRKSIDPDEFFNFVVIGCCVVEVNEG